MAIRSFLTLIAILLLTVLPACGEGDNGDPNEGGAEAEAEAEGEGEAEAEPGCSDGCPSGFYCDYAANTCGDDVDGSCQPVPSECLSYTSVTCGCDAMLYSNSCIAAENGIDVTDPSRCGLGSCADIRDVWFRELARYQSCDSDDDCTGFSASRGECELSAGYAINTKADLILLDAIARYYEQEGCLPPSQTCVLSIISACDEARGCCFITDRYGSGACRDFPDSEVEAEGEAEAEAESEGEEECPPCTPCLSAGNDPYTDCINSCKSGCSESPDCNSWRTCFDNCNRWGDDGDPRCAG